MYRYKSSRVSMVSMCQKSYLRLWRLGLMNCGRRARYPASPGLAWKNKRLVHHFASCNTTKHNVWNMGNCGQGNGDSSNCLWLFDLSINDMSVSTKLSTLVYSFFFSPHFNAFGWASTKVQVHSRPTKGSGGLGTTKYFYKAKNVT